MYFSVEWQAFFEWPLKACIHKKHGEIIMKSYWLQPQMQPNPTNKYRFILKKHAWCNAKSDAECNGAYSKNNN